MKTLEASDLFFGLMCAIRKFGKADTLYLDNAQEVNAWLEGLEDKNVQISFTGMPDGKTVAITLLQGETAINEWRAMGFGKMPMGEG